MVALGTAGDLKLNTQWEEALLEKMLK